MLIRIYKWQLIFLVGLAGVFGFVVGKATSLGRTAHSKAGLDSSVATLSKVNFAMYVSKSFLQYSSDEELSKTKRGFLVEEKSITNYCRLHSKPLQILAANESGLMLEFSPASSHLGQSLERKRSKNHSASQLRWINAVEGTKYEVCDSGSVSGVVYKTGL